MDSANRPAPENLIWWDCPTCGARGCDGIFGDEEVGVCETCDGSGEAEVCAACKQLPGCCECADQEAA